MIGKRLEHRKQVIRILIAPGCIMLLSKIITINTKNEKTIG